jgi:hypothetical protein
VGEDERGAGEAREATAEGVGGQGPRRGVRPRLLLLPPGARGGTQLRWRC